MGSKISNKKIAIFGCKNTSRMLFEQLSEVAEITAIITISPAQGEKHQVAGYDDLSNLKDRVKYFYAAQSYSLKDQDDQQAITDMELDIAFVNGWQRLLPQSILQSLSIGAFGMHGSAHDLPLGRGRSPMNWSLIEGQNKFYTSLFQYKPGIDDGDVVGTVEFSINAHDNAQTLHYKNTLSMLHLIKSHLPLICEGRYQTTPQKDVPPTYYPKRTPEDSIIDWREDINAIDRKIRAVTAPFNGSFSYINGEKITIWRAAPFQSDSEDHAFQDHKAGSIVSMFPDNSFLVRVIGGLLIIHDYNFAGRMKTGDVLSSPTDQIKTFPTNEQGGYDLP